MRYLLFGLLLLVIGIALIETANLSLEAGIALGLAAGIPNALLILAGPTAVPNVRVIRGRYTIVVMEE